MSRSTTHDLQPRTDHRGMSRRLAVLACKRAIRTTLETRLRDDYRREILGNRDAEPERAADIEDDIRALDSYRLWASANRASQDRMWCVLAGQVDADYARIKSAAEALPDAGGRLVLADDRSHPPAYQTAHAIHGQPGGYMLERGADDLAAGVLYEAGGNLYALGQGIGRKDSKGQRLIRFVRERFPALAPRRILELGCAAGAQSTDYPAAFPDAACHAIDLSPGMLRSAHARAKALDARVDFHQLDAAATCFDDGSIDLIVSHNLFHEVAAEHMPAIMRECYRLLAPGGVCIHQDVPTQTARFDAFGQFLSEWQKDNNDEPFWLDYANADLPAMMIEAGFDAGGVSAEYLQAIDGPIPWYVAIATRQP